MIKKCSCGKEFNTTSTLINKCPPCRKEKAKQAKSKPKKPKAKTLSWHKNKAWDSFALLVKLRASEDGKFCRCYTSGVLLEIGTINCQAGHCLPKVSNPGIYFDFFAVRPQSYRENINLGGNHYDFCEKLKAENPQEFERIMANRYQALRYRIPDYIEMREKWDAEIKELQK